MTGQMLFLDVFSEKDPHLNAVEFAMPFSMSEVPGSDQCNVTNRQKMVEWMSLRATAYAFRNDIKHKKDAF